MSQELTESQILAAQMLANGKSCGEVAETLSIRRETVSRWKKVPEFRAEINILIEDTREASRNRLGEMANLALQVIENDLTQTENVNLRTRAAFKVLDLIKVSSLTLPKEPLPTNPLHFSWDL